MKVLLMVLMGFTFCFNYIGLGQNAIPQSVINQAKKYAPEVRLHPSEKYRPSSIPWYLKRSTLLFTAPQTLPGQFKTRMTLLKKGQITVSSLKKQKPKVGKTTYHAIEKGNKKKMPFLLDLDGTDTNKKGEYRLFKNNKRTAGTNSYLNIRRVKEGHNWWDFQYLFFYPYNGKLKLDGILGNVVKGGKHEGDFEHITIRFNMNTSKIVAVYYSVHGQKEGSWLVPGQFKMNSFGQPIVYSAKDSHACYASVGRHKRNRGLPDDYTKNGGAFWDCRKKLIYVGTINQPIAGQEWIGYTGQWGEGGVISSGPGGPGSFLSWWNYGDIQGANDYKDNYLGPLPTSDVYATNGVGDCTPKGLSSGIIKGNIKRKGKNVKGYRVRAYDKDVKRRRGDVDGRDDFICSCVISSSGNYKISYDRSTKRWDTTRNPKWDTVYRPDIYLIIDEPKKGGGWNEIARTKEKRNHRMSKELKLNINIRW